MGLNILREAPARPRQAVLLRGPHDDQLLAAPKQGAQLLRLGVGQRAGRRADHVGTVRQGAGIQRIRFGQLARGAGKIAGLPRVHDDHGQARRGQGARHRALQAARGFQHNQGGVEGLHPVHERRHPAGIVGDGPPLSRGAQGNVQLGFGHIKTDKTWHVTPTNSCLPDLAHTGSMAPDNCTGSGSPGRDDPRYAPVSVDQGSIGLSRPGTWVTGDVPTSPIKIQGYWRSPAGRGSVAVMGSPHAVRPGSLLAGNARLSSGRRSDHGPA